MIPAPDALRRLQEGNERFASGTPNENGRVDERVRAALVEGQRPFAIVLGCSDSRVPAEIVFDQGVGDLFVVRIAGNVAASSQVASVELAAEWFGSRLVVVLGHSRCGAVTAAIEDMTRPSGTLSPDLRSLVDLVRPSVEPLLGTEIGRDPEALLKTAVRDNVRNTVARLRRSEPLRRLIETEGLAIVGGEYALETGRVDFFEGVPFAHRAR